MTLCPDAAGSECLWWWFLLSSASSPVITVAMVEGSGISSLASFLIFCLLVLLDL
jgi:hypothetical protein